MRRDCPPPRWSAALAASLLMTALPARAVSLYDHRAQPNAARPQTSAAISRGLAPRFKISPTEALAVHAADLKGTPGEAFDGAKHLDRAIELFFGDVAPTDLLAVAAGPSAAAPQAEPTEGDMVNNVRLSKRTNPEREKDVIQLFRGGGYSYDEKSAAVSRPDFSRFDQVQSQEVDRADRHNLFIVKKGRTDRLIVVGGHGDKVGVGDGVIDNWTGATMVTHLAQALRDKDTEATYVFIVFTREEEGLIGSKKFLQSLAPPDRDRIDAMINLDTLAVDGTYSWKNNSDRVLLEAVQEAAQPPLHVVEALLNGGDSDSSPFRRARIPAMTIFGASEAVIFDIIHSARDNFAAFSREHYAMAYGVTKALLHLLDGRPVRRPRLRTS